MGVVAAAMAVQEMNKRLRSRQARAIRYRMGCDLNPSHAQLGVWWDGCDRRGGSAEGLALCMQRHVKSVRLMIRCHSFSAGLPER